MIPRHSLPFDVTGMLSLVVSPSPNANLSDLEKIYTDALGVRSVVLLPSVRAGIHMVLQAAGRPGTLAVGPAYTCHTVHEAMALSGVRSRLVDPAADSFLMSPEELKTAAEPGCALVLSEVYGIPYDLKILPAVHQDGPTVRILDMAMNIPSPEEDAATGGHGRCAVQFRVGQANVFRVGRHRLLSEY